MKAWHEDDAFWEAFGPIMFTEELRAAAPADVDAILELVDLPPAHRYWIWDAASVGMHWSWRDEDIRSPASTGRRPTWQKHRSGLAKRGCPARF